MSPKNPTNRTGFTLIELLVVIAIIAILAAILFPVFAAAREKARQTTCLSNLKQLGIGMGQYEQDFDECYPSGIAASQGVEEVNCATGCTSIPTPVYNGAGWAGEIYPYVQSTLVYNCPDDLTTPQLTTAYTVKGYVCSYGMNTNLSTNPMGNYYNAPKNYSLIANCSAPAKTVQLFECAGVIANVNNTAGYENYFTNLPAYFGIDGGSMAGYDFLSGTNGWTAASYQGGYASLATGYLGNPAHVGPPLSPNKLGPAITVGRHTQLANFLMADGHVKALMGTNVSPGKIPLTTGCVQDSHVTACNPGQGYQNAASTDQSTFAATFSPV